MGKRKEVAIINYTQANQINENLVREILFEAIGVDELVHRERQNAKR